MGQRCPARLLHPRASSIYAHTVVVYALDGIKKSLSRLAQAPGLPESARDAIAAARQDYAASLQDLRLVKNSAQQREDRAREMGVRERRLDLQPIASENINGPAGTVLIMSALRNNRLGYTTSDGHHREVEISHASVESAQTAIQRALQAKRPWPRTVPS